MNTKYHDRAAASQIINKKLTIMSKKIIFLFGLIFLASSFKMNPSEGDLGLKMGTYTLSTSYSSETENIVSGIVFKEDKSFTYFDRSKKTEIQGTWKIENNFVILSSESKLPIKNKWEIDSNKKCLKSRKGLAFLRVCNC